MLDLTPYTCFELSQLLAIEPPTPPLDFADFWQLRFQRAIHQQAKPLLSDNGTHGDFEVYDLHYHSTDGFDIGGWVLVPKHGAVTRGVVVGHGYGGRDAPDFHLPIKNAVFLFPCFRGLSRSQRSPISTHPNYHVLHDLDKPEHYILGGCVADVWLAVSALIELFPQVEGHVGYMGISFGGGVGCMALAWDARVKMAHFNVPSFGHQGLRLQMPTCGSAHAVQRFNQQHPEHHVPVTLAYYDAANAAQWLRMPVHVAAALVDPVVTPPGQFAIYNALAGNKKLFVLKKGHLNHPHRAAEEKALRLELQEFFTAL